MSLPSGGPGTGTGAGLGSFNGSGGIPSQSAPLDPQLQYLYTLNSLEACSNCLNILKSTLEQYIHEIFGLRAESELNKIQVCLIFVVDYKLFHPLKDCILIEGYHLSARFVSEILYIIF